MALIRLDIVNGNPRSFVAPADIEQGLFLEIIGKAENVELGVEADYEAYKVQLAGAATKRGQLLVHASVANQYDERLSEVDFVLKNGKVGRGYQPVMGDIITIPVVGGVQVGDELVLAEDGKLAKGSTNPIAVVEALEDITIPEADPQESMVIRFL